MGLVIVAMAASGCAPAMIRDAVPESLANDAHVAGMSGIRVWGDQAGGALQKFIAEEAPKAKARLAALPKGQPVHHHILALSGGADDGAFGAGVLVGWTAHGSRPRFDVVTGVSAGALIAPFAFLGPEYDRRLEAVFKLHGGDDIYRASVLPGLLGGTALADSGPLAELIAKNVDRKMVQRLAEERAVGRLLLIGTTNLDAQRPVYWDLGRIAQTGGAGATDLIRRVLLASASLPGIFPPVPIKVNANGRSYQELHVDGGPTREVFLAPSDFSFRRYDSATGRKVVRSLWVIRNGKLDPEYLPVPATALAISTRSLATLTKYQGLGDLTRIYHNARSEGIDFNLAAIPPSFAAPRPKPFDNQYMRTLFDTGTEFGRSGAQWAKAPPGISASAR